MEEDTNCRICSEELIEKISIQKKYYGKYIIAELIEELVSLEIKMADNYPQSICKQCAEKLIEFHIFRRMILESEDRFRLTEELVNSQQIQKEYNDKLDGDKMMVARTSVYQIDLITDIPNANEIVFDNCDGIERSENQLDVPLTTLIDDNQTCLSLEDIQPSLIIHSVDVLPSAQNESLVSVARDYLGGSCSEHFEQKNYAEPAIEASADAIANAGPRSKAPYIYLEDIRNFPKRNKFNYHLDTVADKLFKSNEGISKIHQPRIVLQDVMKTNRFEANSEHWGEHLRKKVYQCDECSKSFIAPSTFLRHYRHIHMNRVEMKKCPHCPRIFKCRMGEVHDNLWHHIKKVHGTGNKSAKVENTNIQCVDCKSIFNGPIDLYMHSKEHEKTIKETSEGYNLYCDHCCIDLETVARFTEHAMQEHSVYNRKDIKLFRCRWCGHRCKSVLGLYSHIRFNHKFAGNMPLITSDMLNKSKLEKSDTMLCNVCGKLLRRGISYKQHVAIHMNDRKFQCDLCPAKFISKFSLKRHNGIHQNKRTYKCEECGKRFLQKAHLKSHSRQHGIGLKPHQCNICDKEFVQKGSLKAHMWLHKDPTDMPFVCNYCGKGFLWRNQIELHLIGCI